MEARKRIRAVKCMDCEAVVTAQDDAALVNALGKHYVDSHRRLPMTEDRIRKQIAVQPPAMASAPGRPGSEKRGAR